MLDHRIVRYEITSHSIPEILHQSQPQPQKMISSREELEEAVNSLTTKIIYSY